MKKRRPYVGNHVKIMYQYWYWQYFLNIAIGIAIVFWICVGIGITNTFKMVYCYCQYLYTILLTTLLTCNGHEACGPANEYANSANLVEHKTINIKKSYTLYVGKRINLIFGISWYGRLRSAACIDPAWAVNTDRFFCALLHLCAYLHWVVWVCQHQWHRRKQSKIYENIFYQSK